MKANRVTFAAANVYISDVPPKDFIQPANDLAAYKPLRREIPTGLVSSHRHSAVKSSSMESSMRLECDNISKGSRSSRLLPPSSPDRTFEGVQIFSRIRHGSRNILRYPLTLNPLAAALFRPEDLSQSATKLRKEFIILYLPPLEVWEVAASNGQFVTVRDVVTSIYENGSIFPPRGVFNGLAVNDEGDIFVISVAH